MNYGEWIQIFDIARQRVSRLHSSDDRFEKQRLLDGFQFYLKEELPQITDILALSRLLVDKFQSDPSAVEKAMNNCFTDRLRLIIKNDGMAGRILDPHLLVDDDLCIGYVYPALCALCKNGELSQNDLEEFVPTTKLWKEDIASFRQHLERLLYDYKEFSSLRSSNYKELGRQYEALVQSTVNTVVKLKTVGQTETANLIIKKCAEESKHMVDHHSGPWVKQRARDLRQFLLNALTSLPTSIAGEPLE